MINIGESFLFWLYLQEVLYTIQGSSFPTYHGGRAQTNFHWGGSSEQYTLSRFHTVFAYHIYSIVSRAGFNWCEALGKSTCEAPSPIVARKKWKVSINLRKSENDALKVRSVKNSKSIIECPRSLRLLLPWTQKRSMTRNWWNPTWLAGTGLWTATGKPTAIATIEIFDKSHGLRFFIRITSVFLISVKRKQKHTAPM